MGNNFEQEKLEKRVLEKLQNKIITEEFKNKEKIKKVEKIKKRIGLKVTSFLVGGMLVGNVYTYATFNENLLSFILSKSGIINDYTEKSIMVEKEDVSINNNSLTLSSYAMDNESLVITYKLKLSEEVEYFEEFLADSSKIVDGENSYGISEESRVSFYKISDVEYEIVKIYDVRNLEISEDARFVTSVTLYKELDGSIVDKLGIWDFDINIIKNNLEESKIYALENKVIDIYNKDGSRAQFAMIDENADPHYVSVKIEELRQTDLGTKIVFSGALYTQPGIDTFVEILDEKGNVLLANNTEKILGNPATEVLFSKVDLNSKIIINIDIVEYPNNVVAEGSINLDLSKDLIEKTNVQEDLNDIELEWNEICFRVNDNMYRYENFDNERKAKKINIYIGKNEYGIKDYYRDCIEITRCASELSLDKYCDLSYIINLANGEGLSESNMGIYIYNDYIELTYSEIVEIVKVGRIIKNGKEITVDSLKENSIYDTTKITNKEYSNKNTYEYEVQSGENLYKIYVLEINDCKYEFKIPTILNLANEIEEFISSIKIL